MQLLHNWLMLSSVPVNFPLVRVQNCTFLIASATKNWVLATRISQVVTSTQLRLPLLLMLFRESDWKWISRHFPINEQVIFSSVNLWTEIKTSLSITNFHLRSKQMMFCCQAAVLFSFHRRRGNFWQPKTCLRSPVCIIFKNVNFMLCCLILSNLILIFHNPLSSFQCCKCNNFVAS